MCSRDERLHFGRYSPIPDRKMSQVIFSLYKAHKSNNESDHCWDEMVLKICNDLNISRAECLECLEREKKKELNQHIYAYEKFSDLDSCTIALIRRHIHDYYMRGEHPSRNDILDSLKSDNLFYGTILELRHIIKKLGFTYQNIEGKMLLWEKHKIANERGFFLNAVHNRKLENMVWVGETFINIKQSIESADEEVIKEWKVIVLIAACVDGFIENISLVHVTEDINEELDCIQFTDWFEEQLMPSLNTVCLIVLENSENHKHIFDKAPTDEEMFTEEEIKNWLKRNMIEFNESFTKAELICLVDVYKTLVPRYTIDYTAKLFGHQVLRYPVYHNHYNPFQLIAKKIKNNMTYFDTPNSLDEAKRLVYQCLSTITTEDWTNAIDKTYSIIDEACNYEASLEVAKNTIKTKLQERNSIANTYEDNCDESVSELSDETTQYSYDTDINGERSDSSDSM